MMKMVVFVGNFCQARVRSPKVQSPKVKTKGTWADTNITLRLVAHRVHVLKEEKMFGEKRVTVWLTQHFSLNNKDNLVLII